MPTPSQVSWSLFGCMAAIVVVGALLGHLFTAAGIAVFVFLLAATEGKPSWRRIFNPDRNGEGGVLRNLSFKRTEPLRPGERKPPA
ncbi:MAG: hypothetical protein JF623_08530 [Acidobacteria bacterium]|jgi:hypothetical protein|nr:hypothetical protein [Acidobacteriota bacterium]